MNEGGLGAGKGPLKGHSVEEIREQANLTYGEILLVCKNRAESGPAIKTMEMLLKMIPKCENFEFEVILKSFVGTLAAPLLPQYNLKITMLYVELLSKYLQILTHQPSNQCLRNCIDCQRVQYLQSQNNLNLTYRNLLLEFVCLSRSFKCKPDLPQLLFKKAGGAMESMRKEQPYDINHFLLMLSSRFLTGANTSLVLSFLGNCLKLILQLPNPQLAEVKPNRYFLRLLLDPLIILTVKNNAMLHEQFKGKASIAPLNALTSQPLEVIWSDKLTDCGQNYIAARINGMEVFKQLLLLLPTSELKVHLENLAKVCADECYVQDPYAQHMAIRFPEILEVVISHGKWKSSDDGWNPLPLLFGIVTLFQESPEVGRTPLVANSLRTLLTLAFNQEKATPLVDSVLLWSELSGFIFALTRTNLLAVDQLIDCCGICLATLAEFQSAYSSEDEQSGVPLMQFLPDLVQLGAILCVLLGNLHALDCSSALDLPSEVVLLFLEYDQEMKEAVCSDSTHDALLQLNQATTNPALEIVGRFPSSHVAFFLLHYSRETSGRDLIGILLERFSSPLRARHPFSPETKDFALKVVRCESTDHLFVSKLSNRGFLTLLTLLSTCGGVNESPPLWSLCNLAFNLLAGMIFFFLLSS
jgi:hypothetical protein